MKRSHGLDEQRLRFDVDQCESVGSSRDLLWARSPKLFIGVAALYGMIDRRSWIDPASGSLVTVRVSQINDCPFCVDINSATLLKRGVSLEKLHALTLWRPSDLSDEGERAALDYAEAMTRSDQRVQDDTIERLRGLFNDDGIVDLTALVAFQNMSSKFNSALAVPAQGFCIRAGAAILTPTDLRAPPQSRVS